MMKKKVFFACLVVIAGIAAVIISSADDHNQTAQQESEDISEYHFAERKQLRVAVQKYYISSAIGYIVDNNIDHEFGLELVLVEYESGAEQIVDVDRDVYDVATIGAAFLNPIATDQAVIIGEHIQAGSGNSVYVKKDSPILDVKGFNPTYPDVYGDMNTVKDSTILVKENTTAHYLGAKWLESVGVKQEKVEIVYADFEEAYEKLVIGEGDVAVLVAPYSYEAEKNGYVKVADEESLHTEIYEVILATKSAHEEKEEELLLFLKCLLYANELLEADFDEKMKACEQWYQQQGKTVSRQLLKEECRGKIFVTRDNYDIDQFGNYITKYAGYMAQLGNLPPYGLANSLKNIDHEMFYEAFMTE